MVSGEKGDLVIVLEGVRGSDWGRATPPRTDKVSESKIVHDGLKIVSIVP